MQSPKCKVVLAAFVSFSVSLLPMISVLAATAKPASLPLNLASTVPAIAVTGAAASATHILNIGSGHMTVGPGSMLTPAEYVALQGILTTGHQTLLLGNQGQAVGGTFWLNSQLGSPSSLNIPTNVTGVIATHSGTLQVGGLVNDQGSLIGVGTPAVHTITVKASEIDVAHGALLSTIIPTGLTGVTGSGKPTNLSLTATGDIDNAGTISASGKLSLNAGGSISNSGAGDGSGTMLGGQGVTLSAGSGFITNSGSISALSGNVLLTTVSAKDLSVNNIGGQISALAGGIDLRDASFNGNANTTLTGGSLSAQDVNFNAGKGIVEVSVDQIDGVVNVTACSSHVTVDSGTLNLGKINVSGDPTYINTSGNVNLTNNLSFPGQDLAIIASGDVTANNTVTLIDLSGKTQKGGTLSIIAGANVTSGGPANVVPPSDPSPTSYTVGGFTAAGGSVLLPGVSINTSSKGPATPAGQVIIVGRNGSSSEGDVEIGGINASSNSGSGGSVQVLGNSISINGNIDTHSSTGHGGSVSIFGLPAQVSGSITYNDGSPSGGSYVGGLFNSASTVNIGLGSTLGNVITTGKLSSGLVNVTADLIVRIAGNVQANATGTGTALASSGAVTLTANEGSVTVVGGIDDSSKGPTSGGVIVVGDENSHSTFGDVVIGKSVLTTVSGANGTGGDVSIDGSSVRVGVGATNVPVVLKDLGGIVASGTVNGGTVNIQFNGSTGFNNAKDTIVGTGITSTGSVTGGTISVSAQGIFRSDGPLNSSSSAGIGGSILVQALGGNQLSGIEINGNVTANGKVSSNGISLLAFNTTTPTIPAGELIVRGNIVSGAAADKGQAGSIFLKSSYDTVVTGSILDNGANSSVVSITSADGQVVIKGPVSTSTAANGGQAGNITIIAITGIVLGNSVLSQGNGGGNIVLQDNDGIISIAGSVNSSAFNVTTGGAANAGSILIGRQSTPTGTPPTYSAEIGPALITISGSVLANGGSASGATAGSGGNGNNIALLGDDTTFSGAPTTGSIFVGGTVSAVGGSTSATGPKSGNGGFIYLDGATVQVKGTTSGASVNASAGKGASSGTTGAITVLTYPVQPLTTDFNLTGTKADQPVLPGALFQVGNASVNGTTGALVAGTAIAPDKIATGTAILLTSKSTTDVNVNTTFSTFSDHLTITGPATTAFFAAMGTSGPLAPGVYTGGTITRGMATPGEALALLQESRGGSTQTTSDQTIGLTSAGAVSNVTSPSAGGSSPNTITLKGEEFGRPLTAFNLSTAVTLDPQDIAVVVSQAAFAGDNGTAYIALPKTGTNLISGTLNLFDSAPSSNTHAVGFRVDFGSKLTVLGEIETTQTDNGSLSTGVQILPASSTLDLHGIGSAATLNLAGNIFSVNTFMRNEGGALTLAMSDGAELNSQSFTNFNGQLFLSAASGTKLTSPLVISTPKDSGTLAKPTPTISSYDVFLFGKSISVGSLTTSTLTAFGPNYNVNTQIVVTKSLTNTTLAANSAQVFGANSSFESENYAGGNFTALQAGDFIGSLSSSVRFATTGTISIFTKGTQQVTLGGGASMSAGKDLILNSSAVGGGGFIAMNSVAGNVSVTGTTGISLGTDDQIIAAKNVTLKSTASNFGTLQGAIDVAGFFSAGSSSIAQQTTDTASGVLKSFVKVPGTFSISAAGLVNIGTSSFIASTGGNVSIIGGVGQTPGISGHGDVTITGADTLQAVGGNIIVLSSGNVSASSVGMTFSAEGFTTGGSGGVEVRSGTTTSILAAQLAHRPTPLLPIATPPPTIVIGVGNQAGNVQVEDPTLAKTGTSKGIIDFSHTTVLNGSVGAGGAATYVNFNKGVVIFGGDATGNTSVTINQTQITSIDPVSYSGRSDEDEIVVDTDEAVEI